jgi:succinate-semialdehyde dehydrogenase/glutarate-semialdehyde dehydrogenase
MYPDVLLCIDGAWTKAADGRTIPVVNPATEEVIGSVAQAGRADLDAALDAVAKGFAAWRKVSAYERSKVMRKAADLLRERAEMVAQLMTQEQGKPLAQARLETGVGSDIIDWMAEEGRRAYGRIVPARAANVQQLVLREPSSSRRRRRRPPRRPSWCAASSTPACLPARSTWSMACRRKSPRI